VDEESGPIGRPALAQDQEDVLEILAWDDYISLLDWRFPSYWNTEHAETYFLSSRAGRHGFEMSLATFLVSSRCWANDQSLASGWFFRYPYDMNDSELITYVTQRLSEADNLQDIIMAVCEKTGWTWSDAEVFVSQVQELKGSDITRRQFPLIIVLALGTFLVGLGLIAYGVYTIMASLNQLSLAWGYISRGEVPSMDIYNTYISAAMMLSAPLLTGIAMILGSLIGMRDTWSKLLFQRQ
jgi:hypothetical protein